MPISNQKAIGPKGLKLEHFTEANRKHKCLLHPVEIKKRWGPERVFAS